MALDAGNEDLARKALAKKSESDKQVASMQQAVESARQTSEKLKSQVRTGVTVTPSAGMMKRAVDGTDRGSVPAGLPLASAARGGRPVFAFRISRAIAYLGLS